MPVWVVLHETARVGDTIQIRDNPPRWVAEVEMKVPIGTQLLNRDIRRDNLRWPFLNPTPLLPEVPLCHARLVASPPNPVGVCWACDAS